MTNKETTAIALKCFAIYVLSTVLIGFSMSLSAYAYRPSPWIWAITPASLLIGAAVVFVLWKTANSLTLGQVDDPQNTQRTDFDVILKNILICMGVYFAINGFVVLPSTIGHYNFLTQTNAPQANVAWLSLSAPILKISIGLCLIAKPKQWVKMIRSIGEK